MASESIRLSNESRWIAGLAIAAGLASIGAFAIGGAVGVPVGQVYYGYVRFILVFGIVTILAGATALAAGAAICGVKSPLAATGRLASRKIGSVDQAVGIFGPILLIPLLLGAYGTLKQMMPLVAPFAWDGVFAEAERQLFFGHRPWELTHALFGGPVASHTIDLLYGMWVPLVFVVVMAVAVVAPSYLRARFFVTFAGCWLLLGIVGAFLLSSAGPCYEHLVSPNSANAFLPLLERLHSINDSGFRIQSVHWQDVLWQAHVSGDYGFGMGISAMPSLHNSVAFLYVLSARRAWIPLRVASLGFAGVIFVGSVHLGWHYLLDGIVSWAGTALIWWGSPAYLRWCGYKRPDNDAQKAGSCNPPSPEPVTA